MEPENNHKVKAFATYTTVLPHAGDKNKRVRTGILELLRNLEQRVDVDGLPFTRWCMTSQFCRQTHLWIHVMHAFSNSACIDRRKKINEISILSPLCGKTLCGNSWKPVPTNGESSNAQRWSQKMSTSPGDHTGWVETWSCSRLKTEHKTTFFSPHLQQSICRWTAKQSVLKARVHGSI